MKEKKANELPRPRDVYRVQHESGEHEMLLVLRMDRYPVVRILPLYQRDNGAWRGSGFVFSVRYAMVDFNTHTKVGRLDGLTFAAATGGFHVQHECFYNWP